VRLFAAIVPPEPVLAELTPAIRPLQKLAPALRWTSQPAWHFTLAFLAEVPERVLPELSTRLERAAGRHPPLRLAITGGGAFPAASRARVLWAGLSGDTAALSRLAASVAAGARRAGAPPPDEGRKYHPHLTLARCREPAELSGLLPGLADISGSAWTAPEIRLIRSHLSGGQPRYETIAAWPLLGRPR
jgi:2'-5' RNA ligase